ncbi:MAG: hypothetical protein GXO26_10255 [Crenarchaeota archaeon]|jgi:predicted RNA binding protein with dsRBD fold (UPF0201 family)|nr:hypothetical protein [Thermoproteota archaeon]
MRITVWVEVRPSEDVEKVKKAVLNILSPTVINFEKIGDRTYLVASAASYRALYKLRELIRKQEIEDSARLVLTRGIVSENKIVIHVNKQAAYAGHLSFVTEEKESPLGPITIIIETNKIRQLIDWLAPRTVRGERIYDVEPPEDC